jgi:hypothetical protein
MAKKETNLEKLERYANAYLEQRRTGGPEAAPIAEVRKELIKRTEETYGIRMNEALGKACAAEGEVTYEGFQEIVSLYLGWIRRYHEKINGFIEKEGNDMAVESNVNNVNNSGKFMKELNAQKREIEEQQAADDVALEVQIEDLRRQAKARKEERENKVLGITKKMSLEAAAFLREANECVGLSRENRELLLKLVDGGVKIGPLDEKTAK